jgi:hypothetical protein
MEERKRSKYDSLKRVRRHLEIESTSEFMAAQVTGSKSQLTKRTIDPQRPPMHRCIRSTFLDDQNGEAVAFHRFRISATNNIIVKIIERTSASADVAHMRS